jgi:hypothetical protein
VLSLVSGSESTVLATGVSGTYELNTSELLDGSYSVTFTESAPGTVTSVRSVSFYANNQLARLQAELNVDAATIAVLMKENNANASEIEALLISLQTLRAEFNATQENVTADLAEIATLESELQTLQNELNDKKNYIAPVWYDSLGTAGIVALLAAVAIVAGAGAYLAGRRTRRSSDASGARQVGSAKSSGPEESGTGGESSNPKS